MDNCLPTPRCFHPAVTTSVYTSLAKNRPLATPSLREVGQGHPPVHSEGEEDWK